MLSGPMRYEAHKEGHPIAAGCYNGGPLAVLERWTHDEKDTVNTGLPSAKRSVIVSCTTT